MTDQDSNPTKEPKILMGITPEKYAELQGTNINVYEMIFTSSSRNDGATPMEAERAIVRDALEKKCEVIVNVVPTSSYSTNAGEIRLYLAGLGLRLKEQGLP